MNTSYFREFTVLAEVKNYWEAAERLYINQSTLSKHIKSMENELGILLFDRSTRHVELTRYGKALLPYARSITRQESEFSSLLMQMQNQEKGLLRNKKCELIFLRESKPDFEKNFSEDHEIIRIPFVRDHLVALLPMTICLHKGIRLH